MMQEISIPNSSLRVSRLILGCMGLGGGWEAATVLTKEHEREAREFLDAGLELGANFYDHANIYGRGRTEEVFGRILKERPGLRDQLVLQSKVGIRWGDEPKGAPHRFDFSRKHILEATEAILHRLGTDWLDILLLHRPDILWEPEEVAEAFALLKTQGKVRYFGVSNQNRFQMEYLQSFLPETLVANQLQLSLLHNGFAEAGISFNQHAPQYPDGWEGTVEYCRMNKIVMQSWSPLDRGMLVGDLSDKPEPIKAASALVHALARRHSTSPEAIQLAWLLRHPAGIQPVLGTTKPARLRACAKALDIELSREDWYALFAAARGATMP
ncbi:MAG TPA: aldo/keto reductase [Rectinemataceae bacterium]|nr:aldo/keto reductase [Rectinemataceae bacterium]